MADHKKNEDAFDGEWDIPSHSHSSLSSLLFLLARHSSPVAEAYRGRLHRIPELRWEETKTLALIEKALLHVRAESMARHSDERYATMTEPVRCKGGMYVDIASVSPGTGRPDPSLPRLLLRADVDGLPVEEPGGNPGRSKHPGKMHACGHDMHAAMLLTFIRVVMMWLPEKVTELLPEDAPPPFPTALPVNLRCVFQRAEENPVTPSGGYVLCNEDGVLEGVDEVYGLHVWAGLPAGHFYSNPSALMANSDRLRVRISCCGGHASAPHGTRNPIDVAADVVAGLRGFDARTLGPMEPSALVPTISSSGSASNVIPERAELWFGVRNFLPRGRREEWNGQLCQQVTELARPSPSGSPAATTIEATVIKGHPATINNASRVAAVCAALAEFVPHFESAPLLGPEMAAREKERGLKIDGNARPVLGGEDFSHYLNARPGAFFFLGAHTPGGGDHHAPSFDPDASVLWRGVLFWLAVAYGVVDDLEGAGGGGEKGGGGKRAKR